MIQLPDGRWRWEPKHCRPLCYECEAETDLFCYDFDGEAFWFCSPLCASRYAKRMRLDVDHVNRTLMDDRECGCGGDYDCCDDAEDYGEDDDD